MVDNVPVTPGSGAVIAASDDVAGVQYQRIKVTFGVDGVATDVSSVDPLPANVAQMNGVAVTMGSGVTGTGVQRVVLATDVALPTGANVIGALTANQSVNNAQINGVAPLMGNGVTGTGSQRVTIASDNTAFSVNAVQSGAWNIGTVTTLPALVAGSALIGKVGIDQTTPGTTNAVNSTPATPTAFTLSSAATTNLTSVKASAGTLYTVAVSNNGAAAAFLKLYNKASAPVLASDVPVLIVPVGASSVVSLNLGTMGMRLGTGIALAITNLIADTDATAVVAAQVKTMLAYI